MADNNIPAFTYEYLKPAPPCSKRDGVIKSTPKRILNVLVFDRNSKWAIQEIEKKVGHLSAGEFSKQTLSIRFQRAMENMQEGIPCVTVVTFNGQVMDSGWNMTWYGMEDSAGWHIHDKQEIYDFRPLAKNLCQIFIDAFLREFSNSPSPRKRLPPNPEQLTRPLPLP